MEKLIGLVDFVHFPKIKQRTKGISNLSEYLSGSEPDKS